jgi:hypothetical protein
MNRILAAQPVSWDPLTDFREYSSEALDPPRLLVLNAWKDGGVLHILDEPLLGWPPYSRTARLDSGAVYHVLMEEDGLPDPDA